MGRVLAAYGGGFKPPTRGHFEIVKTALNDFPEIDEFYIYVGGKVRDGIDQFEAIQIWDIYKKYLANKVDIQPSKSPIGDILRLAKDNPQDIIYFVIGYREGRQDDLDDVSARTDNLKEKYPNIIVKVIPTYDPNMSGTNARKVLDNEEEFVKFLPYEVEEKSEVFKLVQKLDEMSIPKFDVVKPIIDEFLGGAEKAGKKLLQIVKREGKQTLVLVKEIAEYVISGEKPNEAEQKKINKQLLDLGFLALLGITGNIPVSIFGILYWILQESGVAKEFLKLDEIALIEEWLNEADPKKGTGKKPKGSSRRLYTDEDPKDTVGVKFSTRQDIVDTLGKASFKAKSHARQSQIINLIHQRVRAALARTKDPDKKKKLKAGFEYIKGKKEASKKKTQRLKKQKKENVAPNHNGKAAPFGSGYKELNEGKYDSLVTKLAGFTLNAWKGDFEDGQNKGFIEIEVGPGLDFDYPHLKFIYKAEARFGGFYKSSGAAIPDPIKGLPRVRLNYNIPIDELPRMWSQISMDLRNTIRHEIEHLMQSGPNVKKGKEKAPDRAEREELITGKKPWWKIWRKTLGTPEYYKLEKEIDANLEGLYLQAKKSRKPLEQVIDNYLKFTLNLKPEDRADIKALWKKRAPKLNIPLEESKPIRIWKNRVTVAGPVAPAFLEGEVLTFKGKKNRKTGSAFSKINPLRPLPPQRDFPVEVVEVKWNEEKNEYEYSLMLLRDLSRQRKRGLKMKFQSEEDIKRRLADKQLTRAEFERQPTKRKDSFDKPITYKSVGHFEEQIEEGDTYEKMAAKGKKAGNLKQGTVRKRLGIPKDKKIPLSKINKELSRLKKMDKDKDKKGVQLGDKNQKYYKALQLSKTLKTTTNVNESATYSQHIDLIGFLAKLTQYMLDKGMNIEPLPNLEFIDGDIENAKQFLGKTAYYDPNTQTIALYTEGRHPKDIARSYAHEMIHHIQYLENRLGNVQTTNTLEDDNLDKLEQEANLRGTMTFRNFTDSLNEVYKHKFGFNDKLGKDPFGLNQFAREIATEVENAMNKKEYKIFSDMDGVITDFNGRFEKYSDGIPPSEYEKRFGKEKFWELADGEGVAFWVGMPWMSDGKTYWDYIKNYDVELLSSPSRSQTSRLGKRLWVRNNLPGVKLTLAQAAKKQNYAAPNHILIDDRESNIEQWRSQGGIGILHTSAADTIEQLKQLGL